MGARKRNTAETEKRGVKNNYQAILEKLSHFTS